MLMREKNAWRGRGAAAVPLFRPDGHAADGSQQDGNVLALMCRSTRSSMSGIVGVGVDRIAQPDNSRRWEIARIVRKMKLLVTGASGSYQTLKPSILDGSLALMQAGVAAGIRCFVYSSSLLVYRGSRSMVGAHTPANPALDYGRIKVETEKRLLQIARSAGISFSALRLPHVYGMRDLYFQQLQAGRLILPGLDKNTYTHLHVADAAAVIIACAEQAFEGILPVGDHRPSTWNAFLKIARQHFPKARIIRLPQWLALLATALLTPFRRIRPHPGLETPGAVRTYNFNLAVDPDLVWKDLDLKPRFNTIEEGIPAAVATGVPKGFLDRRF